MFLASGCVVPPGPPECVGSFHAINSTAEKKISLSEADSIALCKASSNQDRHG